MLLISKFLSSQLVTVVLVVVVGLGGWFIYSELQAKAVIEKELKELKASKALEADADKAIAEKLRSTQQQANKLKTEVRNATNQTDGRLSDESVRRILCANGLANEAVCANP